MFYVKGDQGNLCAMVDNNIYVDCGDCGKVHSANYEDFAKYIGEGGDLFAEWMCKECSQKLDEAMKQTKREDFDDTLAENNNAMNAGFALMDYIQALNLPAPTHNDLIQLIDHYRAECETGAEMKGAKERPYIEEFTNGVLTAVYNEDNKHDRQLAHEEMLERIENHEGEKFTPADFREHYEMYLDGGDCEDPDMAADMRRDYPNLCKGKFDDAEWVKYVEQMYYEFRDCVPGFPQD